MKLPASPAPAARPFLEWMPIFLATRAVHSVDRACHVAKVTERTVTAAIAKHPAFARACQMLADAHERREVERKPATPSPAPASAAALARIAGNNHAIAAVVRADLDTLALFCARIADAAGLDVIEGQPVVTWYMNERRAMLERNLLAIGDTDPDLYEHLQRHLGACRGQADPNSILQPPEAYPFHATAPFHRLDLPGNHGSHS